MWRKIIFRFALKGVKGGNRCQVMSLSSLRVGTWMLEHPWILLRKRTHTIGFLSSSFIFSRVSTDINKCRRTTSWGWRWRSSRYYYLEGSQVRHCLALPARSKSCTQGPMIEHSCNNEGEFLPLSVWPLLCCSHWFLSCLCWPADSVLYHSPCFSLRLPQAQHRPSVCDLHYDYVLARLSADSLKLQGLFVSVDLLSSCQIC
jgi:hypothetical protein